MTKPLSAYVDLLVPAMNHDVPAGFSEAESLTRVLRDRPESDPHYDMLRKAVPLARAIAANNMARDGRD
jgi:hypothetical protein